MVLMIVLEKVNVSGLLRHFRLEKNLESFKNYIM